MSKPENKKQQSSSSISSPHKSAAGIILSEDNRVLLARRNPALKFMGGCCVFPGGRIDEHDGKFVVAADDSVQAAAIGAAAREIFEESGLLLVRGAQPAIHQRRAARQAVLDGQSSFNDLLQQYSLRIDARDFRPAGVFLTPETSPIRFHARYYLVRQQQAAGEELIAGEIVGLDWMRPSDARRLWRQGTIQLAPPVAFVLHEMERFPIEESLRRLADAEPVTAADRGCFEVRPGILIVQLRSPTLPPAKYTNCVIVGQRELLVIDPGATEPQEQARLKEQIERLIEQGGEVAAILLTHGHRDHVGSAVVLREHYGAPIWAHRQTAAQVQFTLDRLLSDNETIELAGDPDWRLRSIHTPGHDPGHLCFLEETTRTLIAGDMIAQGSSILISPDHGGDMTAYLASLERLLDEEFGWMIPSHGFPIARPKEKILGQIEHRLWREEKIKAALDSGAGSASDLLALVYEDVPKDMWKYAEHSLRAHLIRLGMRDLLEDT